MHFPLAAEPHQVWRAGVRTACSGAGLALLSSFTALGALMGEAGFSLGQTIIFSLFGFALPGQLVAAELHAHGAGVLVIAITVFLVNARLFPMTVALLPLLVASGEEKKQRLRDMLLAHWIAVTSWVCFLATYAQVAPALRRRYFAVLGGTLWGGAAVASVVGFFLGAQLPHQYLVALLFLNPVYFLCLMIASLKQKSSIAAFAGGMLLLPLVHQFSPQWDIMICGALAGLTVWLIQERR